jgi:hypothetical protein
MTILASLANEIFLDSARFGEGKLDHISIGREP